MLFSLLRLVVSSGPFLQISRPKLCPILHGRHRHGHEVRQARSCSSKAAKWTGRIGSAWVSHGSVIRCPSRNVKPALQIDRNLFCTVWCWLCWMFQVRLFENSLKYRYILDSLNTKLSAKNIDFFLNLVRNAVMLDIHTRYYQLWRSKFIIWEKSPLASTQWQPIYLYLLTPFRSWCGVPLFYWLNSIVRNT